MPFLFCLPGLDFQPYLSSSDFLSHFNSTFPARKNPTGLSSQVMHSSPLGVFVASPIKEEDENPNPNVDAAKTTQGRQESREHLKQVQSDSG